MRHIAARAVHAVILSAPTFRPTRVDVYLVFANEWIRHLEIGRNPHAFGMHVFLYHLRPALSSDAAMLVAAERGGKAG